MVIQRRGLWRHPDFLRLWASRALSAYGSRITRTALPMIAVATLNESALVTSLLIAGNLAPGVALGAIAGGFVDRTRKRRILIACDLVRAAALAAMTVGWLLGALAVWHVIAVGAVVGAASALFLITDNTFLPLLVGRGQLAEGNAKLESTEAVAEITGPASAGYLIAALGAPLAVVIDAATYLGSAALLSTIKTAEPPPVPPAVRPRLLDDLRVGLRAVFGHPVVRPIVLSHMVWSISGGFFMALYVLFLLRDLQIDQGTFGVIVAMGGVGSLAGALLSRKLVRWLGLGPTLIATSVMSLSCALFIPLAGGSFATILAFLILHQLLSDGFSVAFVIQAVTLRQTVLPRDTLGRANAAVHVVTSGLLPVSAIAAGVLAELLGTRTAVWIGVLIGLVAPLLLLPLRHLREMPSPSASGELPLT